MNVTWQAALAAHRFGLGEPSLAELSGSSPVSWLRAQIGPGTVAQGDDLASSDEILQWRAQTTAQVQALRKSMMPMAASAPATTASEPPGFMAMAEDERKALRERLGKINNADARSRLLTAEQSTRPFNERLVWFWSNHFTVSLQSGKISGLAGAFEREAIRPHVADPFLAMLRASTLHPAMLRYLDNQNSIGPESTAGQRQRSNLAGLNENLAREVLELHTLGADSARAHPPAYTQADVTAFAQVLTGWTSVESDGDKAGVQFIAARHQPGPKQLLGKTYPEGPDALDMVLRDLARHPATARHLSLKLARYFVADDPPPALVDKLSQAFANSGGALPAFYRALIESPESWDHSQRKLKTPEEHAVTCARLLKLDAQWLTNPRGDGFISQLGQNLQGADSPAGWSDQQADWLGPEAMWKRVEWTNRLVARYGLGLDARALAQASLGPMLSDTTATEVAHASDGRQALVLLLLSPELQRR
jgi:uncharacterized protein (DUF1800 family)